MPPETQYQPPTDTRAGQSAGRLWAADLQPPESVGANQGISLPCVKSLDTSQN